MSGRGVNHCDLTDLLCPPFLSYNSSYSPRALTKASIWDGFIEGSSPSPISVVPKFMARMVVVSAHSMMRCTGVSLFSPQNLHSPFLLSFNLLMCSLRRQCPVKDPVTIRRLFLLKFRKIFYFS